MVRLETGGPVRVVKQEHSMAPSGQPVQPTGKGRKSLRAKGSPESVEAPPACEWF